MTRSSPSAVPTGLTELLALFPPINRWAILTSLRDRTELLALFPPINRWAILTCSLRDRTELLALFPPINRWAILTCPSGTEHGWAAIWILTDAGIC